MDLFNDQWIRIQDGREFRKIALRDILCGDFDNPVIDFGNDNLDFAAFHLLVCLTQVAFAPADEDAWRRRLDAPLTDAEWSAPGPREFLRSWFDPRDPETPFMQRPDAVRCATQYKYTDRDPETIQRIFPWLPSGVSHAHFNAYDEIKAVCGGCASVALFNLASAPTQGGGFKAGLRGNAPITTLVADETVRRTIWRNVMPQPSLPQVMPDRPVWVEPIEEGEILRADQIGLLRGLFWMPLKMQLADWSEGTCDVCFEFGQVARRSIFERLRFRVEGSWPHPHSPTTEAGIPLTFGVLRQAWAYLPEFLGDHAAPVVARGEVDQLFVGGYWADRSKIYRSFHGRLDASPDARRRTEILRRLGEELGKANWAAAKAISSEPRSRAAANRFWHESDGWNLYDDPRKWSERAMELFEEVFPPVALMQRGMVERGLRLQARLNSVLAEFGIGTASGEPEIDFGGLTVRTGRRGRKPSESPSPAAAAQRRTRAALADRKSASPTNGLAGGRPRKYATDEERRAAKAASAARYRKRMRERKRPATAG